MADDSTLIALHRELRRILAEVEAAAEDEHTRLSAMHPDRPGFDAADRTWSTLLDASEALSNAADYLASVAGK